MKTPHRIAALAVALLLGGCIPLPGGHTLSQRQVAGKADENLLIAYDGATCRVPARTFERVQVGDAHTCAWKETGEDGAGRTMGDPRQTGRRAPQLPGS